MRYVLALLSSLLGAYMSVLGIYWLEVLTQHYPGTYFIVGHVPWGYFLVKAGLQPMSWPVALAFLAVGIAWIVHAVFIVRDARNRVATTILCAFTFWYAPYGTILSIVELCVVWLSRRHESPLREEIT